MTVEKFKVTCPTCGRAREVKGRSYYNAIMRGRESDRCKPCGAKAGIQKRLAAIARKKEGETIESCGCVLTFAETFCEDGCWMSRRCEKWDDCGNKKECYDAVEIYNWPGFTADCAGFVPRQFDRLMRMSDVVV